MSAMHRLGAAAIAVAALFASLDVAAQVGAQVGAEASAKGLRELYEKHKPEMQQSRLHRQAVVTSAASGNGLQGDAYGLVDQPLSALQAAFSSPQRWCTALLLHPNNRDCRVVDGGAALQVKVVRAPEQAIDSAFDLRFALKQQQSPDHLGATLASDAGPFGTSNYRIHIGAVAIDARRSFVHLSYGYEEGTLAHVGTQAYLSTFGAGKVGFTVESRAANGSPNYIGGARGLMERNAMRYFLVLDAASGQQASETPSASELQAMRNAWFDASERSPRQLHEIGKSTYLDLKKQDDARRMR